MSIRNVSVLIAFCISVAMQVLDITIVNVALVSMKDNLHMTYTSIEWVVSAYQLSYAGVMILASKISDLYNKKYCFLISIFLFGITSLLCGMSNSEGMLISMRAIQGISAGFMYPLTITLLRDIFKEHKQYKQAITTISITSGLALITGPILGGLLLRINLFSLEWRSIFYINIPLVIIGLLLSFKTIPNIKSTVQNKHINAISTFIIVSGILGLLYGLIEGRELGWPIWIYLCMIGGIMLIIIFYYYDKYLYKKEIHKSLINHEIFKSKIFNLSIITAIAFYMTMASFMFALTIVIQLGFKYTAFHSGITLIPFAIGILAGSLLSSRLRKRIKHYIYHVGSLLIGISLIISEMVFKSHTYNLTSRSLILPLIVFGLGVGTISANFLIISLVDIKNSITSSASGVLLSSQQIGVAIGISIIGAILFTNVSHYAKESIEAQKNYIYTNISPLIGTNRTEFIYNNYSNCIESILKSPSGENNTAECKSFNLALNALANNNSNINQSKYISQKIQETLSISTTRTINKSFIHSLQICTYSMFAFLITIIFSASFIPIRSYEEKENLEVII